MELQKKFDKWLEDEKFVTFANKRLKDEILHVPENHLLDPKHEELEEGFENYDCYAAPLATYLTYCLQLAKCSRNAKKRKRGIWWVYVQVHILGFYTKVFACEVPYKEYLRDMDAQLTYNLIDKAEKQGKFPGLRVGSLEEINNNAGNWE